MSASSPRPIVHERSGEIAVRAPSAPDMTTRSDTRQLRHWWWHDVRLGSVATRAIARHHFPGDLGARSPARRADGAPAAPLHLDPRLLRLDEGSRKDPGAQ